MTRAAFQTAAFIASATRRAVPRALLLTIVLSAASKAGGQTASLISGQVVSNSTLLPYAGASVYICSAGSTGTPCSSPPSIFADAGLSVPLSNPIAANGNGFFSVTAAPGAYYVQTPSGTMANYSNYLADGPFLPVVKTSTATIAAVPLAAPSVNNLANLGALPGTSTADQFNKWISGTNAAGVAGNRSVLWVDPLVPAGSPTSALGSLERIFDARGTNCLNDSGTFFYADNSLCIYAAEDRQDTSTVNTAADFNVGYESIKGGLYTYNDAVSGQAEVSETALGAGWYDTGGGFSCSFTGGSCSSSTPCVATALSTSSLSPSGLIVGAGSGGSCSSAPTGATYTALGSNVLGSTNPTLLFSLSSGVGYKSNRSTIAVSGMHSTVAQKWGVSAAINSYTGGETIPFSSYLTEYGGFVSNGEEWSEGLRIQQQQPTPTNQYGAGADGQGGIWQAYVRPAGFPAPR